jgi:outer membrane receptor protein involved in Fe transport
MLELFAGVAATVRLPDAQERYFSQRRTGSDWVGNPGLNPTRGMEANLGINLRKKSFFVKPALFWNSLSDFIVVQNQLRRAVVAGVVNTTARSSVRYGRRVWFAEMEGLAAGA